jgi:hypothetical protein
MVVAIGSILASRFMRDWAWAAFDAEALKRSTKLWRWARSASCFCLVEAWRRDFSARRFSKSS